MLDGCLGAGLIDAGAGGRAVFYRAGLLGFFAGPMNIRRIIGADYVAARADRFCFPRR